MSSAFTAALAMLLWALASQGCVQNPGRTVSLRVQGNVPDASVTIDDQYVGALAYVASRGVALPPGKHRITVERLGYFPWDRLVEADDDLIRLDVRMVKVPD